VSPSPTVTFTGSRVTDGSDDDRSETTAVWEVTWPTRLLTTTSYRPASAGWKDGMENWVDVAPWRLGSVAPPLVSRGRIPLGGHRQGERLALIQAETLAGCRVIFGAIGEAEPSLPTMPSEQGGGQEQDGGERTAGEPWWDGRRE
jgi:hypothetical protein